MASFPYFNGTGSVQVCIRSLNRRNNEALAGPIQTYTEPVLLKYGKLATKYPWIHGYFYSVDYVFLGFSYSLLFKNKAIVDIKLYPWSGAAFW